MPTLRYKIPLAIIDIKKALCYSYLNLKIKFFMKKDIHPIYFADAEVTCACGNSFVTGSTQKEIRVELCSSCHPFYTGTQKLVDTARRVEKFEERTKKKDAASSARKGKKVKKAAVTAKKVAKKKEASSKKEEK